MLSYRYLFLIVVVFAVFVKKWTTLNRNFSIDQIPNLKGKNCLITGGNVGIGYHTALELARKQATVFLACRSLSKCEESKSKIISETGNSLVECLELDLSSLKSIRNLAQVYIKKNIPLDLLINNAGVMAIPFSTTQNGIETQFAVNHLGHFFLTHLLTNVVQQAESSRIVTVSSNAHWFTYSDGIQFDVLNDPTKYHLWKAYGQSKLANILFTHELAARFQNTSVYVNAAHPGWVKTELARHVKSAYGETIDRIRLSLENVFALNASDGALTTLYLATSSDIVDQDIRGQYYAPIAVPGRESYHSNDIELQKKLWEFSEKLVESY